jgi:hypothetical protein
MVRAYLMCRVAGLPGSYGQTWPDGYFRVRDLIQQIKMDIFGGRVDFP